MMRNQLKQALLSSALGLGVALTLPRPPAAIAQQQASVTEGARVYGRMCGRCHNPRSPLERSDRDWVTIANHMRVRANLTGGQVRDVLAFLQASNSDPRERVGLGETVPQPSPEVRGGPPSTDPATVARGKELVAQKACVGCHVIENTGGQIGPSLNGVVQRRGADFVRRKLADPTFNNATSMMPNFGLSAEEIEALLAYLATLGSGR
ncbi:MAG: hypothetical protein KatS3mg081_1577 [Gemmatimonadales bacterium]|nr:MAG: hypothetical protein KatS3mg081_1577 [Gemmatimonadales bacterium]